MSSRIILFRLVVMFLVLCVSAVVIARTPPKGAGKIRVLFLYGGHAFDEDAMYAMLDSFADITYVKAEMPKALDLFKPGLEKEYDCLVMYDSFRTDLPQFSFTKEQTEQFKALLKQGIGLVVLHHSVWGFVGWDDYANISGCQYFIDDGNKVNGVTCARSAAAWADDQTMNIKIADKKHPITAGTDDFTMVDEAYIDGYIHPDVHVLWTTDHPKSDKVIAWTWKYGNSPVFTTLQGHDAQAYNDPNFRRTVHQAIQWTVNQLHQSTVPSDGIKVTEHTIGGFSIPEYYIPLPDSNLTSTKNTDLTFPIHNDGEKNTTADFIGANHIWPGYTLSELDCLNDGGARMKALGSTTIKTYLVNYYQKNYPVGTDWGTKPIMSAVELAQTKHYLDLFAQDLKTFTIGCYIFDNTFGNPPTYFKDQFPEEARRKEYQELYDLTYYLCKTYAGTGKTFVIKNWEGDWACMSPPDAEFDPPQEVFDRMIAWTNTRQDAVMAARNAAGCKDVYVYHAIEVNLIAKGIRGRPCVTNNVIPHTYCDFYAYSAYDTQETEAGFSAALDHMLAKVASNRAGGKSRCFIGEFGWPFRLDNEQEEKRLKIADNVLKIAREKRFAHAYWWELYDAAGNKRVSDDPSDYPGYWLVTVDGKYTAVWNLLYKTINGTDFSGP